MMNMNLESTHTSMTISSVIRQRSGDPPRARREYACVSRLFRRCGGILAAAVLLVFAAECATAQDGRALLMQTLKAYHALSSYACTSSVSTIFSSQGKPLQIRSVTTEMEVKRPNKLKLTLTQPGGTVIITSDGTTLIVYNVPANQYTRGPAATTLEGLLPLLFVRAHVIAALDPLYFFSRNQLPGDLTALKKKGSGTVNGRPVTIVEGIQRSPARLLKGTNGKSLQLPAETRYWTWWIDTKTHLFAKIETETRNLPMRVNVRQGKKIVPRQITVTNLLRYVLSESKPDGAAADSLFVFTPPAGATEFKSAADILKGGK
jgi:outer membrane lipoprotein-sorting protein